MTDIERPKPQVLSVDDEVNILRAIKRTLRHCDVDVTTAESGAAALALMEHQRFDLIISDMRMPKMTGAEFLAVVARQQPDCKRVLLTGYSDLESTIDAINLGGVSTYLSKPWDDARLIDIVEDAVRVRRLEHANTSLEALTQRQNEELKALNEGLEQKVEERTAALTHASGMLEQAVVDLRSSHRTMVSLLSDVVGLRDALGAESNGDKVGLCMAMAEALQLPEPEVEALEQAARLHRIGRATTLPDAVLTKPYLQLTDAERKLFDQHPVQAEAVLLAAPELNDAARIIRSQHERWDGQGFPDRLARERTPLPARVLAIVRDYYDLIAGLYERVRLAPEDAVRFVQAHAGSRYDPRLVEVFLTVVTSFSGDIGSAEDVPLQAIHLRESMELARELKTAAGVMLLPKGHVLAEKVINKIVDLFKDAEVPPLVYVTRSSVFDDVA